MPMSVKTAHDKFHKFGHHEIVSKLPKHSFLPFHCFHHSVVGIILRYKYVSIFKIILEFISMSYGMLTHALC